jgi:uncharacterized protein
MPAALVLIGLLVLPVLAAAQTGPLPALTRRVVDAAQLIDPASEATLVQTLEAHEKRTSDQIVVATIDSLAGEAIEPYATRLFNGWALGQAGRNNGVLLLIAKNDRKMRIEVGIGLESRLTNKRSKEIIDTMVPAFRAGDFSAGISRAVGEIIQTLQGRA